MRELSACKNLGYSVDHGWKSLAARLSNQESASNCQTQERKKNYLLVAFLWAMNRKKWNCVARASPEGQAKHSRNIHLYYLIRKCVRTSGVFCQRKYGLTCDCHKSVSCKCIVTTWIIEGSCAVDPQMANIFSTWSLEICKGVLRTIRWE